MEGVESSIHMLKEFGASKEQVLLQLTKHFSLSEEDAQTRIQEFWD